MALSATTFSDSNSTTASDHRRTCANMRQYLLLAYAAVVAIFITNSSFARPTFHYDVDRQQQMLLSDTRTDDDDDDVIVAKQPHAIRHFRARLEHWKVAAENQTSLDGERPATKESYLRFSAPPHMSPDVVYEHPPRKPPLWLMQALAWLSF